MSLSKKKNKAIDIFSVAGGDACHGENKAILLKNPIGVKCHRHEIYLKCRRHVISIA
jgi:hypothetical protein